MIRFSVRRFAAIAAIALSSLAFAAAPTRAALITFNLSEIGTFSQSSSGETASTYSGDGFVGMYPTEWAHLFGLEYNEGTAQVDSMTNLQANIAALQGATITSATLSFTLKDGDAGHQDIHLISYTSDGTLRHNFDDGNITGLISTNTYDVAGLSANALDVTAILQERVDANANWLGLRLNAISSTEKPGLFQWTYTDPSASISLDNAAVRLAVVFDGGLPEPTAAISALGFAALMMRRRREHR